MSDKEEHKAHKLIDRMVALEELENKGGVYWVTSIGHAMYADALEHPYAPEPHYYEWMDTVLTGMDRKGRRVNVENPALPRCAHLPARDPESDAINAVQKMCSAERRLQSHRKTEEKRKKRRSKRYPKTG